MTSTVQNLIDVAAQSAVDAGRLVRQRFGDPVEVSRKQAAHDVVTGTDLAAEALIRAALGSVGARSTVVGEEGGRPGGTPTEADDPVWLVDPIDGTYNFVRGIPFFCVSIGLRIAGRTVGGCVYDPLRDELFTAADGRAWLNGAPLPTRSSASSAPPLVLCDIPNAGGRRPPPRPTCWPPCSPPPRTCGGSVRPRWRWRTWRRAAPTWRPTRTSTTGTPLPGGRW
ncbi:inositol monophosphatase family protein [Micromonospora sp. BRA006-A]|nr:inositol monophosphatase family protein [Micromonospora sp. BRA006-A]